MTQTRTASRRKIVHGSVLVGDVKFAAVKVTYSPELSQIVVYRHGNVADVATPDEAATWEAS